MSVARDKAPTTNVILGAGEFYTDRLDAEGKRTGAERYVGDSIGGTLSATVQRTTINSGDGAVGTKLIDKVTSVDRTMGLTLHDMTLENWSLFLIGEAPRTMPEIAEGAFTTTVKVPDEDWFDQVWFQLGATSEEPVGQLVTLAEDPKVMFKIGGAAKTAPTAQQTYDLDSELGRICFTGAPLKGQTLDVEVVGTRTAEQRVQVKGGAAQVRAAIRYIEQPDTGVKGRNIYIPRASIAPAGEAQLKSRDTEQQLPLTCAIEEPGDGLAQIYIDGEPQE